MNRTRTLAEAAADVLNATRKGGEPMHTLPNSGSGLDGVVDLGGATFEDPQGGDVGKRAAAAAPSATAPGAKPAVGQAPNAIGAADVTKAGTNDTDLASTMNKSVKGKMQPVAGGAMAEETDEDETTVDAEETDETDEDELTEEQIEAARKARWDNLAARMKELPVKEDIDALFSGETLSEEFKTKATTIFEAAVLSRAVAVAEGLEEEMLASAAEAIVETRKELEEKVEDYLNFVVTQWIGENTVAIESGLRSEIAEDFMGKIKAAFEESYVEVPEEKVDLLGVQEEQIAELTQKVNEALNANVELTKKLNGSKKQEILNKVCEGLTATQASKVKTLAEGVEFTTEGEYTGKVAIIKESYVTGKVKDGTSVVALTESAGPAEVVESEPAKKNQNSDPFLEQVARTISATK